MTTAQKPATGFPYSVLIPLDRRTVSRFPRKDLETFARIQLCRELPGGLEIPKGAQFTYALAENRTPGSPWTHVMRVQAEAVRETR